MSKSLYCSRTAKAGNLTRIDTQLQNHAQYTEQKGSCGPSISMVPKDQSLKVSVYHNNFQIINDIWTLEPLHHLWDLYQFHKLIIQNLA